MSGQRKFKLPEGAEGKPARIQRHRATLPTAAELDAASRFELAAALRELAAQRRRETDRLIPFAQIGAEFLDGMKPGEIRALCDRHAVAYKPNGPHNGSTDLAGKQRLVELVMGKHGLEQAGIHEVLVPDSRVRGRRSAGRAKAGSAQDAGQFHARASEAANMDEQGSART
jgi:hypothetical protein